MQNRPSRGGHPCPSIAARSQSHSKTARDQLRYLHVDAEICPQVLLRVLGLVARHGVVPNSIGFERRPDRLLIEVVIDSLGEHAMTVLLEATRAIINVRSAQLCAPTSATSGSAVEKVG